MEVVGGLVALCLFDLALVGYLLPTIVAWRRGSHQFGAIFALNLLLAWSVVGWIAALIWAFTSPRRSEKTRPTVAAGRPYVVRPARASAHRAAPRQRIAFG